MKNLNWTYLFLLFLLSIFFGCRQEPNKLDIEKAILDLTERYTQLPKGTTKQMDFYRLIRTVTIGEKDIQLQLRSTPDSINDPQQIILIINPQGQIYAIPFFSNTYRDYWNFQFDNSKSNIKKTNTTFLKEFNTAINTLNLNDTLGTGEQIICEILLSLIHCDVVSENDSSFFNGITSKSNDELPFEDFDSCIERSKRNFQAILKGINPHESVYCYNAYWDKHNNRIYQINYKPERTRKKLDLKMDVYRQDCNIVTFQL